MERSAAGAEALPAPAAPASTINGQQKSGSGSPDYPLFELGDKFLDKLAHQFRLLERRHVAGAGISSNTELGIFMFMCNAMAGGVIASSSPTSTSVGTAIFESSSV